jgi:2-polyprenyl-3-methyl-5-hydroxy-6-metoxy-1,4-benzoquinol methylase
MTATLDPATTAAPDDIEAQVGAFAERIAMATIGSFELSTIELGNRLGLYAALADGPATPPELAARTGIDARYAREWLEQQATAGIVAVAADPTGGPAGDPDARVFSLPLAHQVCLLDPDSLASMTPLVGFAAAAAAVLPELVEIYRTGAGLSFGGYGADVRHAQELANRPQFVNLLASVWLPAMPDVVARLEQGGTVADIACGCGWSSIAIARAFPNVTVHAFDLDEASIADAKRNAQESVVADRVHVEVRDAADAAAGAYDLVCCFEALHDMAHPVAALEAMRRMATDRGTVFVIDDRTADQLTQNDPDPMQRLFYAASVLHCLPVGRSQDESAATGTVMRTTTLEGYAADAGFASVDVLPLDHDMFRFYRLR